MQKTIIVILLVIGISALTVPTALGDGENPIAKAFEIFALGQGELILQNDRIIQQNEDIITLLKGDRSIFVAGLTDRYVLLKWDGYGICTYFDKLLQEEESNTTCPVNNLTRDEFTSLITGNPEN